jgi:hypothetical protein
MKVYIQHQDCKRSLQLYNIVHLYRKVCGGEVVYDHFRHGIVGAPFLKHLVVSALRISSRRKSTAL